MQGHSRSQSAVARRAKARQSRYIFREQAVVIVTVPEPRSFSTHVLQASIVIASLAGGGAWLHHLAYAGHTGRLVSYFPWG